MTEIFSIAEDQAHVAEALDLLLEQFKRKDSVEGLLTSYINPIQILEGVTYDIWDKFLVDSAVGDQLDILGNIVQEARGGKADASYRQFIKARIAINRSNGRVEEILSILRLISPVGAVYRISEIYPAKLLVDQIADTDAFTGDPAVFIDILRQAKGGGIGIQFTWSEQAEEDRFCFGDVSTATYSELINTLSGVRYIVYADDYVYWTDDGDGTVNKLPSIGGGQPAKIILSTDEIGASGIDMTSDGRLIYATDNSIRSVHSGGGVPIDMATAIVDADRVRVYGLYAYFWQTIAASTWICRVTTAGGLVEPLADAGTVTLRGLAVDSEFVYFGNVTDGRIQKVALAGGSIVTLNDDATSNGITDLALTTNKVIWTDNSGTGYLRKIPKTGGAYQNIVDGIFAAWAINIYGDNVYYAVGGSLYRIGVSDLGGTPAKIYDDADGSVKSQQVASDGYVYWSDHERETISRQSPTGEIGEISALQGFADAAQTTGGHLSGVAA